MELQENDILVFKNGKRKEYTQNERWLIQNFYDSNLQCSRSDGFSVVRVLRPRYEEVFSIEKVAPVRKLQK